jgi:hypothetical protein
MTRSFESGPAKRERTPLMVAIVAPSGAGKTKSALRLAAGFSRVTPGDTVVIDTEAKRALHYAGDHKFIHLDFPPPHGPVDYIEAGKAAMKHSPTTIIVDQCSYEWEGMGGVLEQHDVELDRMAGNDYKKRERCTMAAWIKPKAEHNKFRQFMLQQRVNWILLFRAKEKIKPQKGGEPRDLGWQPIGGEDLFYECFLRCLLLPGADGKPTWQSDKMGELDIMRLPDWFRDVFAKPRQIDEDIGEQLARWAAGGDVGASSAREHAQAGAHPLVARYVSCHDRSTWDSLELERGKIWKPMPAHDKSALKAASDSAMARISSAKPGDPTPEEVAEIMAKESKENR